MPSPSDFALTFTNNCNSNFTFNPASRIPISAQTNSTYFSVTYNGNTVPPACQLNFSISALSTNNFVLGNNIVFISAKPSIDRSALIPPLIL